jgi:hypothetical protein
MLFLENKYTVWYYSIINTAKDRISSGYTENHHIIPKTLGGKNNKNNVVSLTAREHFVCHLLLTKMLTGQDRQKMVYALHMLSNAKNSNQQLRYSPSSKLYEYERKIFSEVHSERMKINHPLKNPENLKKLREGVKRRGPTSVKGRKMTEESKQKLRGKEWTQKALDNRLVNCLKSAEARKGSKWSEEQHAKRFNTYLEKNKHLFPQVLELYDSGLSIRQVSFKLDISWDRVKYIVDNRERLNTV